MKKIAVVCAAGKEGRCLVEEAVRRGHAVTGFVRALKGKEIEGAETVVKDLFDLTAEDLAPFDAVIDAFGAWTPETLPLHTASLMRLCDLVSGTAVRLLVVGGAGSLYIDPEHRTRVMDLESFPEAFKALAAHMGAALEELRKRKDVRWTYLSPAGDFQAEGARTGKFILGAEEYFVNDKGESRISYADYAIAMIDEAEKAEHIRKRFSVIGA